MCDKITIKAFLSNTKENEKANKGLPRFDKKHMLIFLTFDKYKRSCFCFRWREKRAT